KANISIRYFLVELLTGVTFLGCWLAFGNRSAGLALVACLFLSGLIVATFIDFELLIIPDGITIGGMVVGVICLLLVPTLHREVSMAQALKDSLIGMAVGGGLIYGVLRAGKLAFGRYTVKLPTMSQVIFSDTGIVLPTETIPFEELFYRQSDTIVLEAER